MSGLTFQPGHAQLQGDTTADFLAPIAQLMGVQGNAVDGMVGGLEKIGAAFLAQEEIDRANAAAKLKASGSAGGSAGGTSLSRARSGNRSGSHRSGYSKTSHKTGDAAAQLTGNVSDLDTYNEMITVAEQSPLYLDKFKAVLTSQGRMTKGVKALMKTQPPKYVKASTIAMKTEKDKARVNADRDFRNTHVSKKTDVILSSKAGMSLGADTRRMIEANPSSYTMSADGTRILKNGKIVR